MTKTKTTTEIEKLAEKITDYFKFKLTGYDFYDEALGDTKQTLTKWFDEHYNKQIDECLDIIALLPIEIDSIPWHELGELKSKLEAMIV